MSAQEFLVRGQAPPGGRPRPVPPILGTQLAGATRAGSTLLSAGGPALGASGFSLVVRRRGRSNLQAKEGSPAGDQPSAGSHRPHSSPCPERPPGQHPAGRPAGWPEAPTAAVSPPPPIMTFLRDPRAEEEDGFLLTCHPPPVRRPGPGPRTPSVLTRSPPDSGDTSYPQPPSGKETPVFLVGTGGEEAASLPRVSQVGAEGPRGARLALQPPPPPDSATKRTSHTWQGTGTLSSLGSLGLAGGRGQWD